MHYEGTVGIPMEGIVTTNKWYNGNNISTAGGSHWNTYGRNDNCKGSNGIPLVQQGETIGMPMGEMIRAKDTIE